MASGDEQKVHLQIHLVSRHISLSFPPIKYNIYIKREIHRLFFPINTGFSSALFLICPRECLFAKLVEDSE